jgi:hypothetical protein
MEADQAAGAEKRAMLAASAPRPTKPFSVSSIQQLIKQFNSTVESFSGGELPDVEWMPPEREAKWNAPLPVEIYAPLVAMRQAVDIVGDGEFSGGYKFQPTDITDDMGIRKTSAELAKMSKDKKLIAAMRAPLQQAAEEAGSGEMEGAKSRAPSASSMRDEDKALMNNME